MKKTLSLSPSFLANGLTLFALTFLGSLVPMENASAQSCFPKQPLSQMLITSNFGMRKHPDKPGVTRPHEGCDLNGRYVDTFSVDAGMVLPSNIGVMVILLDSGLTVKYRHFNRNYVQTGDRVTAGQLIGQTGKTQAVVPHLHFEVNVKGKGFVDPRPYLCNPRENQPDAGPNPLLNPNAVPGGPVGTAGIPNNDFPPMGSGPAAVSSFGKPPSPMTSTPAKQASEVPDYTGQSVQEFLARESTRRFGNPQWQRDLSDPLDSLRNHPDPLVRATASEIPIASLKTMVWREILFMSNLKEFYALEKYERGERMEQMMATDLADRVSEYSDRVLGAMRAQAASR